MGDKQMKYIYGYIYAVLLLNETNTKITKESLTQVMKASGNVDNNIIKVVINSLSGLDIGEIVDKVSITIKQILEQVPESEVKEEEETFDGLAGFDKLFE